MRHKIEIVSASCCDKRLLKQDNEYLSILHDAIEQLELDASVSVIPATGIMYGYQEYITQLRPLFREYGFAVAPALFINGKLELYGGVPPLDVLTRLLEITLGDKVEQTASVVSGGLRKDLTGNTN